MAGIAVQAKLKKLTYSRNTFGMESVLKLEQLIQTQDDA